MGIGVARQAITDAISKTENDPEAIQLTVANLDGKNLVSGESTNSKQPSFYLRKDLWELTDDNREAALRTMYLAMFDELHVGYKDRSCLTDTAGEKLICPGGNGMFRPFVLDRGRVVAVNPKKLGLIWEKPPSKRLELDTNKVMTAVASRLSK